MVPNTKRKTQQTQNSTNPKRKTLFFLGFLLFSIPSSSSIPSSILIVPEDQKRRVANEPSLSSNKSTGGWGCTCRHSDA
ncbi:hypothetical protein A2U01_0073728 [Trifolium medium]|uniref:Uncharacterized protein n=1 Tax=Trifolium medium TaxID=97028 RepID=A0A392SW85_9FABA|nr:hypothetical protein [Trifolium medium]